MLFTEALEHLKEGKYISRPTWNITGEYIVLMPGMPYIWKILTQPNPNAGNWLPLMDDLLATDWECLRKEEPVTECA